jgi:hypothetical protein
MHVQEVETKIGCKECDDDINLHPFAATDGNECEWRCSGENQPVLGDALLEKKRSGSSTGESRCYTVSVTCGFVDILLVRIEKGVDRGDDVPCL